MLDGSVGWYARLAKDQWWLLVTHKIRMTLLFIIKCGRQLGRVHQEALTLSRALRMLIVSRLESWRLQMRELLMLQP